MLRRYGWVSLILLLTACTTASRGPEGETRYRYSTFDFSGQSWTAQKKQCEGLSMKPKHIDTECGFFFCTSRYVCAPLTP